MQGLARISTDFTDLLAKTWQKMDKKHNNFVFVSKNDQKSAFL